jgi:hypothetical protein
MEIAEDAREAVRSQKSFASHLFEGSFDANQLFPFPEQPPEERAKADLFIEQLTTLLHNKLNPDEVDASGEIPKEVIADLATMGAFALKIPAEYGGLGFSQTSYNRIMMAVASYCGATAVLLSAHQSIGVPQPLVMFGTEEQKRKFLPRFRSGAISAFALTEPGVGSDPAQMQAEAVLSADGSHYILNGEKLWCTNGTIADIIIVIAKTAPKVVNGKSKPQISAFILEMNSPGVEIVHRCRFMGLNGIYNGLLRFTNVKIPKENLIDKEGRGLAMALGTINVGRLTLPAACTGVAKAALSIARKWGNERVQWGMPIGLHEAGREKIAFIASTTMAMEAMSWLTSAWVDKGIDVRIEAAMAKLFCTEMLWRILDQTVQLRGGRGYEKASSLQARGEEPVPIERMLRDSRINTILEGSSEIMHLFLAREAIDSHLQRVQPLLRGKAGAVEKLKTIGKIASFYASWYPQQLLKPLWQSRYPDLGPLAHHYTFASTFTHTLARTLFQYIVRYREGIVKRQLTLGRLMDISTDLFAMAAVCSYATSLAKTEQRDSPIALADYFCLLARRRIETTYSSLSDNDDSETRALAKRVLNQEALWLEEGIIAGASTVKPQPQNAVPA